MLKYGCWLLALTTVAWGQAKPPKELPRQLMIVNTVTAPSEMAGGYGNPLQCDANGNLYLHAERGGAWAIRKLSPKGEMLTLYNPNSNPDFQVDAGLRFWVQPDGEVYQIIYQHVAPMRAHIFVYKSDGTYKSKITLDVKWMFFPQSVAVYSSGNMLITGESHDPETKGRVPFTGIFSADGKLLKVLNPEGEEYIETRGVNWSQMEAAKDGNVYVMRYNYPTTVYVISAGGAVVRKFSIDPGSADYRPADMHIAGNRMAVLFFKPHEKDKVLKLVDLEGNELATYDASNKLGAAFACYTLNPERFLFLSVADDHRIQFRMAEVR